MQANSDVALGMVNQGANATITCNATCFAKAVRVPDRPLSRNGGKIVFVYLIAA